MRALSITLITLSLTALAGDGGLSKAEYEKRFVLQRGNHSQLEAIRRCLDAWGDHPFDTPDAQRFREIETSVRVMGFGSNEIHDATATSYPQLVLIQPSVNALTKSTYQLLNPNGWYCFHTAVNALSSSLIRVHCDAHLADSRSGIDVLGESASREGGVTVLASSRVEKACN